MATLGSDGGVYRHYFHFDGTRTHRKAEAAAA
jgi:hypothetical protein